MIPGGQGLEHARRVGAIDRLAEDPAVAHDDRVGGQHDARRMPGGDDRRLVAREPFRIRRRRLAVARRLIDIGGIDVE